MAKGTKGNAKGARSGPGWKFVDPNTLQGNAKKAWDTYCEHWNALMDTLENEWNTKFPQGIDGKSIVFKTENDELKYLLKAKRSGPGPTKGDDVFANP